MSILRKKLFQFIILAFLAKVSKRFLLVSLMDSRNSSKMFGKVHAEIRHYIAYVGNYSVHVIAHPVFDLFYLCNEINRLVSPICE